jgi:two-component system, NtrC family, nitrogen regulation sensor histidine kinase NtrY
MVYLRFYVNVVVRVLLLLASCMGFAFTWYGKDNYFTLFNLGLLIALQVILFIYYGNKTNRDLAYFFDSIRNEDSGITFSRDRRKLQGIYWNMDAVNQQIIAIRIKYASQDQYFKTIMESIQTGIISFDTNGVVDILNKAARNLLRINSLHRIETLNSIHPELGDTFAAIRPSEKRLFRINSGSETLHLSLLSAVLKMPDKEVKIVTFHDIKPELDKQELESWQKLIRILNHEIMNSLAPIISTVTTLTNYLSAKKTDVPAQCKQHWDRMMEKITTGLSIIQERSEGLKGFVEHYKTLNMLPQPVMTTIPVRELFLSCKLLLQEELHSYNIQCMAELGASDMTLTADKSQLEQVLLNLVKNSIASLSETQTGSKMIRLKAFNGENGRPVLQVVDNGKGIPPELIDQIFIPFFTTREKGSGIGLSLSRQIMHLHKGTIEVYSGPYQETVFTLTF